MGQCVSPRESSSGGAAAASPNSNNNNDAADDGIVTATITTKTLKVPRTLTEADKQVYGPFVGDVSPNTALAIMRVPPPTALPQLQVTVAAGDDNEAKKDVGGVVEWTTKPDASNDYVGRLRITGLQPNTHYTLADNNNKNVAKFWTLPAVTDDDETSRVSFVFSSCIGGQGFGRPMDGGWGIFEQIQRRQPDFFLLIGDSIYADDCVPTDGGEWAKQPMVTGAEEVCRNEDQLYARYRYHLRDKHYMSLLQSMPTFCIWDDHEVRDDWGLRKQRAIEPIYVREAAKAFTTYWPIEFGDKEHDVPELPGKLYRSVPVGTLAELFILDCRSYRAIHAVDLEEKMAESPPRAKRAPSRGQPKMACMLGDEQLNWLMNGLAASKATWKFIVSSVPCAWDTGSRPDPTQQGRDGWSDRGARVELGRLLTHIYDHGGIHNVVFITADVHFPSATRYHPKLAPDTHAFMLPEDVDDDTPTIAGPVFHEFGAGPLAALCLKPADAPNGTFYPEVLFRSGDFNADNCNFGHVTVTRDTVTYEVVHRTGEVQTTITVEAEKE